MIFNGFCPQGKAVCKPGTVATRPVEALHGIARGIGPESKNNFISAAPSWVTTKARLSKFPGKIGDRCEIDSLS